MSRDSILTPFTAVDGENVAMHDWPRAEIEGQLQTPTLGTVLIVHGLGEHALRYAQTAAWFNAQGYHVRSYDQYGHGQSGGKRGDCPSPTRLIDDLGEMVLEARHQMDKTEKLILLGHSMGGAVAAQFVANRLLPIDGLILSSPALDLGLKSMQKTMLKFMLRFAPHMLLNNGLKIDKLCRDPKVVQAYRNDPMVHPKISAAMVEFMRKAGEQVIASAPNWRTPTLLIYAGRDKLVSAKGSAAFAKAAPASVISAQCFGKMQHEILNDPERHQVHETIKDWLETRIFNIK